MSRTTQKKRSKHITHTAPYRDISRACQYRKEEVKKLYAQRKINTNESDVKVKLPPSKADLLTHMPLYDVTHGYGRHVGTEYRRPAYSKKGLFVMSLIVLPALLGAVTPPASSYRANDVYTDLNGVRFTGEMKDADGSITLSFTANHLDSLSIDTSYTTSTAISGIPLSREMSMRDLERVNQTYLFNQDRNVLETKLESDVIKSYKHETDLYPNSLTGDSNSTGIQKNTTLKQLENVALDTKTKMKNFVSSNTLNVKRMGFFRMQEQQNRDEEMHTAQKEKLSKNTLDSEWIDAEKKLTMKEIKQDASLNMNTIKEDRTLNQASTRFFPDEKIDYPDKTNLRDEILKIFGGEKEYANAIIRALYKGEPKEIYEKIGPDRAKRHFQPSYPQQENKNRPYLFSLYHLFEFDLIQFKPSTRQYMKNELEKKQKDIMSDKYISNRYSKRELCDLNHVMLSLFDSLSLTELQHNIMGKN